MTMKFKELKDVMSGWLEKQKTRIKTVTEKTEKVVSQDTGTGTRTIIEKITKIVFGRQLSKIQKKLEQTESKLEEIKQKKKKWDETQCDPAEKFNEDKIAVLRSEIKKNQVEIAKLYESLRLERKPDIKTEIEEHISYLQNLASKAQEKLRRLNEELKEYLKVSGMRFAELEAKKDELIMQLSGSIRVYQWWIWIVEGLLVVCLAAGVITAIGLPFVSRFSFVEALGAGLLVFVLLFALLFGGILASGYRIVRGKYEWVMELFGEFVMIWEPGYHFKLPIIMERRARVFMGDITLSLTFNGEKDEEGKTNSIVDFLNASAGVVADVFFRIFSSYRATYNIDDLKNAVSEKMEAGIRAYYGNETIDEAIAGRAEVDLRKIITQNATEADVFKSWGAMITSLAVTSFILPTEVDTSRRKKLEAEKNKEVAEVDQQTASIKAETARINGQAEGNRLKALATTIGQPIEKAVEYELMVKRLEAYQKSGLLIVGDQGDAKSTGAIAGAAAQVGARAATPPAATPTTGKAPKS